MGAAGAVGVAHADGELDPVAVSLETDRLSDESFVEMMARERRVIEISTRVRRAGAELCPDRIAPILGIQVISVRGLPAAHVNAAIRRYGASRDVSVAWVVPGSAAERAGLLPGDVIRSVDGFPIKLEHELNERRAVDGATSLRFAIERAGEKREIDVPYEPGCYVQPELVLNTSFNAAAQWRSVVVFSELVRAARNDDEIAAIVGHELGHKVLRHAESSPSAEADADYFGLYLSARAGYSPEAGAEIWRRRSRSEPWTLVGSTTHPSAPQRTLAAQRAIAEIAAKRAAGAPLIPDDAR